MLMKRQDASAPLPLLVWFRRGNDVTINANRSTSSNNLDPDKLSMICIQGETMRCPLYSSAKNSMVNMTLSVVYTSTTSETI